MALRFVAALAVLLAGVDAHAQMAQIRKGGMFSGLGASLLLDCPLASNLTCTTGETLTFTRSTTGALCMDQGLNEHTRVTEPAINTACFNDVHGVRVVGAIKNELGASETFDDSVADWLPAVQAAVVTLDQDDSPLAGVDSLADLINDNSGVDTLRVRQSVALSTPGKYRFSAWLRKTSAATSTLQVEADSAVAQTQTCNVSVGTTYQRFDCTLDATGTFTNITVRIFPVASSDGTQQGSVYAWGAQLQGPASGDKGEFLAPYCRSTNASATTCATEALSVTGEVKNAAGTVRADFTPMHSLTSLVGSGNLLFGANGSGGTFGMLYRNPETTTTLSFDGTTSISMTPSSYAANTTQVLRLTWLGGTRKIEFPTLGESTSGAYDGSFQTTLTGLGVGSSGADSRRGWGYFKHLQIYSKPTKRTPTYTALVDCSLASDLTCASGDTLTFARSTVGALCPTDAGETTFSEPAINTACHHPTHGVRVVGSIRNELNNTESINAWTTLPGTVVTADQKDAPLSGVDSLADKVEDNSASAAGGAYQSVGVSTAGWYRCSAWLCADSARTARLQVRLASSPETTNTCTVSVPACGSAAPYTFQRFDCAVDATGQTFTSGQCYILPTTGTASETGSVYAWGAQLNGPASGEQGKFLAPYCRSTGGSATTCARDSLTTPLSTALNIKGGSLRLDITPIHAMSVAHPTDRQVFVGATDGTSSDNVFLLYRAGGSTLMRLRDGTTESQYTPTGWDALETRTVEAYWRNNRKRLRDANETTANVDTSFDGTILASDATVLSIGTGFNAPESGWAYLKNLRILNDADPIP